MKIDLHTYITNLPTEYVVIRKPAIFPDYVIGSDIDILCRNLDKVIEYSKSALKEHEVQYKRRPSGHYHINIMHGKSLHLKLDFIDSLRVYKSMSIPSDVMNDIYSSKVRCNGINEPSQEHDLLLRYFEYHEFVQARPSKIKHRHYIESTPNGMADVIMLLDQYRIPHNE